MTNLKYEKARNALIPFAEKYADKKVGAKAESSKLKSREEWSMHWNVAYLGEMDRLARECGVVR